MRKLFFILGVSLALVACKGGSSADSKSTADSTAVAVDTTVAVDTAAVAK